MNICSSCQQSANERFVRFIPLQGETINLKNLQKSIQPLRPTRQKCKCGVTMTKQRKPNDIIVFDADGPIPDVERVREIPFLELPSHSIDELIKKIDLDGKCFHLFAVVCYEYGRKHFTTKIRRPNGHWELYDDLEKVSKAVKTHLKDNIQALFYLSGNFFLLKYFYK